MSWSLWMILMKIFSRVKISIFFYLLFFPKEPSFFLTEFLSRLLMLSMCISCFCCYSHLDLSCPFSVCGVFNLLLSKGRVSKKKFKLGNKFVFPLIFDRNSIDLQGWWKIWQKDIVSYIFIFTTKVPSASQLGKDNRTRVHKLNDIIHSEQSFHQSHWNHWSVCVCIDVCNEDGESSLIFKPQSIIGSRMMHAGWIMLQCLFVTWMAQSLVINVELVEQYTSIY